MIAPVLPHKAIILSPLEKVVFFCTALLFFTPLLPRVAANVILAIFVVLCIVQFFTQKVKTFHTRFFIVSSLLFIVLAASLIYTDNLEYGFKKLITALPLIIIPLALSLWSPRIIKYLKKNLNKLLYVYLLAIIGLSLMTIIEYREYIMSPSDFHNLIIKNGLAIGMEALYYSFHLAIALIITVHLFWSNRTFYKQALLVLLMVIFSALLLMLSFKSTIISFIVAFGLYALKINHYKVWTLFTSILIVVISLLTFSKSFNRQFADLFFMKNKADIEYAEIKKTIQLCAIELAPRAGFIGFGIGDGKAELIACYDGKNNVLKNNSYNSHNQYLGIYLNVGFIGLIAFAVHYFTLLFLGLNKKNHLGTSMLILLAVFMLAENILEREQGVYYFALFLGILFLNDFKISSKYDMVLSHEKVLDSLS